MHLDWQDVLSLVISLLASVPAAIAILQMQRRKQAQEELRFEHEWSAAMHNARRVQADISDYEGGYPVPPNVEAALARVIADGAETGSIDELWRAQRAALRHIGCERWIFNIIDGPNRHRMEFISQSDADNFVRGIQHGFIHNMEQRVVARDPLRTFGDPIAHVLPQRYELEYTIITTPMEAVGMGGIPLRSNIAAERFGEAFGPLPPDYQQPQIQRITERGRHFALGVMYMGRRYDVGVHAAADGRDFEFDPNPNITPEMLSELRHQILADMRTREEFYHIMAARTGVPVQALDASEQQRQAMLYGSWERRVEPPVERPDYNRDIDVNNMFEGPQPVMRETPTASSCYTLVNHTRHVDPILDEVADFRLSDEEARRLAERMQANDRQERESRRRFTESMRRERQSEQEKKAAHRKAIDLLKNILTDDELRELDDLDSVTIKTSEGLFRVKIDKDKSGAPAYNVYHKRQKWCVNLSQMVNTVDDLPLNPEGYPTADHYAMQILLLKTDPKRFMKTANKKPYDDD